MKGDGMLVTAEVFASIAVRTSRLAKGWYGRRSG